MSGRFAVTIDSKVANRIRERWDGYRSPGKNKRSVIATNVASRDINDLLHEIVALERALGET